MPNVLFYVADSTVALEDLTTYTEVDQNGDITMTSSKADYVSLDRNAISYVYKDFGVGNFSNFDIDFEFYIDQGAPQGVAVLCALSNTIGTLQDMITANDGLQVFAYNNTNNLAISIRDWSGAGADDYIVGGGTTGGVYYSTFSRSGTTLTLTMYSDANRTAVIGTMPITCETTAKRYLHVLASRDAADFGGDAITGYTQNFRIN